MKYQQRSWGKTAFGQVSTTASSANTAVVIATGSVTALLRWVKADTP